MRSSGGDHARSGPKRLTPSDVRIIRSLHEDARAPAAKIANRLGMAESTVRHRINRLVEAGVVEFCALTNPFHFGYQIWTVIEVQAEMPKIRSVAQRLSEAPEVYFIGITTGNYDLLVNAVFRSNEELLDFITERLSRIPGIIRTSTSSILEVVKRTMTFGLPDDSSAERSPRGPRQSRDAQQRRGRSGVERSTSPPVPGRT